MEDSYLKSCEIWQEQSFDLFGVFDGHEGNEVAEFVIAIENNDVIYTTPIYSPSNEEEAERIMNKNGTIKDNGINGILLLIYRDV